MYTLNYERYLIGYGKGLFGFTGDIIHMRNKVLGRITIVFSLLAIIVSLYCLACGELEDDKIWRNARMNQVLVRGMTKEEAKQALEEKFQETYKDCALTVSFDGKEYKINVFPTLGFDASAEIDKVYRLGHDRWYLRGVEWVYKNIVNTKVQDITVYPHGESPEVIREAMEASGLPTKDPSVESVCEVTDTAIRIRKGMKKNVVDTDKLEQLLLAAIDQNDYETSIECPVTEKTPEAIDFQKIYDETHKDKKNAALDKTTMEITDSQNGISFDVEEAEKKYEACGYGEELAIELKVEEPEVTTQKLKDNLFSTTLASYTTHAGGTEGRLTNVSLAVKSCNGVILLPGETFSYNDTLGERTAERGYKAANAYSEGEVVEQLGGGICQVSSTLFSALLHTDLEIVSRSNHSMPVSYLPMGMDAAVSWGAPDLKFKNNFSYPVKLSASFSGGDITFRILGAGVDDKKIDIKVEKTGEMSAKTYRKYYKNGKVTKTVLVCSSKYKPLKDH